MPKCVKCLARKGKRYCPALDASICPSCCAEHRLGAIRCPSDCPHLAAEFYQQQRREERSQARGRSFLDTLTRLFPTPAARAFAYMVNADVYWWTARSGPLDNRHLAAALRRVKESSSRVVVPSGPPPPLTEFLLRLIEQSSRYAKQVSPHFQSAHRNRALETLAAHVEAQPDAASCSYLDEARSHFDMLDFDADLGYSPEEEIELPEVARPASGFRETPSGLIVPER